jgi:hypothetical protein
MGLILSALAEQSVRADSVEAVEGEPRTGTSAICNSKELVVDGRGPLQANEHLCPRAAGETAWARAYLIVTARPGYTMTRQGPEVAIGRLHPEFVNRLAAAIAEARSAGLAFAGIFSAYRPPAFGVGGFVDKFHSLHTYGLAVDITGIGAPGTSDALLWHEIAARHGVICPYGPHDLLEWNHCQPIKVKVILADNPLRQTVTADGPISLESMFEVGYSVIAPSNSEGSPNSRATCALFQSTATSNCDAPLERHVAAIRSVKIPLAQADSPVSNANTKRPRVGWPKDVPRIANLEDQPPRLNSGLRTRGLPLKPIVIPRIIAGKAAVL